MEFSAIIDNHTSYGALRFNPTKEFVPHFFSELFSKKNSRIRLVNRLPQIFNEEDQDICNRKVKYDLDESVEKVTRIACTSGSDTWILKNEFAKLTISKQALLLLHERIHSINLSILPTKSRIMKFTVAMKQVHQELKEQQRGNYQQIEKKTFQAIKTIRRILNDWKIIDNHNYQFDKINRNAGGRVAKNAIVHSSAFIGITTSLNSQSEVKQNAILINTNICDSVTKMLCSIGEKSKIISSSFDSKDFFFEMNISPKKTLKVENFPLSANGKTYLKTSRNSQIINSYLGVSSLLLGENAIISNSHLEMVLKSKQGQLQFPYGFIHMSENSKIENSKLTSEVLNLSKNATIKETNISRISALNLKEDSLVKSVNLKTYAYTMNISPHVFLKNISFEVKPASHEGRRSNGQFNFFSNYKGIIKLEVHNGSQINFTSNIDFQHKVICPSNMNIFSIKGRRNKTYVSLQEISHLEKHCK